MEPATIVVLVMTAIVGGIVVWMAVKSRTEPAQEPPASSQSAEPPSLPAAKLRTSKKKRG